MLTVLRMEQSTIPAKIVAGTTVSLRRSFSEYPASEGWAYKLYLAGLSPINKDGTADGNDFLVELTATDTGGLTAGSYRYIERVTKGTEVFEVGSGRLQILANLATAVSQDMRPHPRIVLDAIEAVIEGRATKDQMGYQIAGRALSLTPIADLLLLRMRYKDEVSQQDTVDQLGDHRIRLRFKNA